MSVRRLACSLAWAGAVFAGTGHVAFAQTPDVQAVVAEIAGENVYLTVGTDVGVAPGDTLLLLRDPATPLGDVRVVAATSTRALVAFLDSPFALTRGTTVFVRPLTGDLAATPVPPAGDTVAPASPGRPQRQSASRTFGPRVSGWLSLDMDASQMESRWLTNVWESTSRQFATPAGALRLTIADLPGGFTVSTNVRAAYRYASDGVIGQPQAIHVYEASLAKSFAHAPLAFRLGRFFNPYEVFSGYWDGGLVRIGGRGLGIGAVGGFEPDRYSEGFSTQTPKFGGFADVHVGGPRARYDASAVVFRVEPEAGLPARTTGGWSQALRAGPLRMSTDVQIDRTGSAGRWTLSRFQGRLATDVGHGVSFFGRVGRDGPWLPYDSTTLNLWRRDQAGLGVSTWGTAGSATVEGSVARIVGGVTTYGASVSLSATRIAWLGVGANAFGGYWDGNGVSSLQLSAGVNRPIGTGNLRLSYQFFRSTTPSATYSTHAGDFSLTLPLSARTFWSVGVRGQWGANLRGVGVHAGLSTGF